MGPLLGEMRQAHGSQIASRHLVSTTMKLLRGCSFVTRLREPDVKPRGGPAHIAWRMQRDTEAIEPILLEHHPDLGLGWATVNSTIAVSLAAVKLGIPVAHVESGLRSFERTMPERDHSCLD